jgi:hypothetical protein
MHVLYDWEGPRTPIDAAPETAPAIGSIGSLVERLRAAQESLRRVPLDDLLGLCDAAATAWARADHPLCETIRRLGLGFLLLWMRRPHLASVCNRSLRGHPEALDRFVHLGETDAMLVRAQPRGLAVHWTAGNVPVLAFLSFLQSAICKNANLVKVSRESAGLLPRLLQGLADVEYTNDRGETITGRLLAGAVAVVYADRDDAEAARELSLAADVRVAWGGLDAVEAIMNLPRRFGTEDIVFGPKLSLAIVGAERLADAETAQRVARAVAADACAFDQRGCNSPHTVFVERGGGLSPREFARLLADAMEIESRRSPLQTVDPAATMNVLGVRAEYAMRATAYHDRELSWTVVYGEDDAGLAEPCFLRTLFVRPVGDVFDVVPLCGRRTQTVGLAVDDRRHRLADALTARDVERCPAVGAMRLYETPWDGLFPMDRLVRWVSTY